MKKSEMFEKGILKPGQEIQIINRPESRAVIVSSRNVKYNGQLKTFTEWAQDITGWKSVNIFRAVELSSGERLSTLRDRHLNKR